MKLILKPIDLGLVSTITANLKTRYRRRISLYSNKYHASTIWTLHTELYSNIFRD